MARHVFQPCSVFGSTWLPSLTVYRGVEADLFSQPGGGGSGCWARALSTTALPKTVITEINTTPNTCLIRITPHCERCHRAARLQDASATPLARRGAARG